MAGKGFRSRQDYLQHHCRSSSGPRGRTLDYFMRCKPLADNIRHLNHIYVPWWTPFPHPEMGEGLFLAEWRHIPRRHYNYNQSTIALSTLDVENHKRSLKGACR
jgi:hypothetical protein